MGLETCATLGMLKPGQAERLKCAGLDYYNHNLDTSPEFYGDIVTTRDYRDRLETLERVRGAGVRVCCGGIVGMGESRRQRAGLIAQLANLDPYPESVPINHLVQVKGTPLHDRLHGESALDPLEFVRTIAAARITMPKAMVRLSAGRREFGRAAATYDAAAVLEREVARRMVQRLDYIKLAPQAILDAGCGTGEASAELAARYPAARIVGLDAALPMAMAARLRMRRT